MAKTNKPGQNSQKPTLEMLVDLTATVMRVLSKLSFGQVKYWLGRKGQLEKMLSKLLEVVNDEYTEVCTEWQKFYVDHFNVTVDFSEVAIPMKPSEGSWRLVFIAQGLTLNQTLAAMRKKFKVWVYTEDLDANVTVNTRTSTKSYAVWVRDGMEPDEKYLGKSTRDADMAGTIGITLLERLVLEVKYFVETGKHLDSQGVTFCSGSRYSDGYVPCVDWNPDDGKVYVYWKSVDDSDSTIGLRLAVS